jgi:UDP:flavonoid glycosyltransferase YjiC (YdhE family)
MAVCEHTEFSGRTDDGNPGIIFGGPRVHEQRGAPVRRVPDLGDKVESMSRYLFTVLPTNDLGLLTRSLPIARELQRHGHEVAFCHPAAAPRKLIAQAGFENRLPNRPLYRIAGGHFSAGNLARLFSSPYMVRDSRTLIWSVKHVIRNSTAETWTTDHFRYLRGVANESLLRGLVEGMLEVMAAFQPDVVVDFWNEAACLAARACGKPLVAVMQADQHPRSQGFIWWRQPPPGLPGCPIAGANAILADHGAAPIRSFDELCVGDLTLVLGTPETDPLPPDAGVTYVGPVLWEREDEPLPDRLADLDRERPVIWLYPGKLLYMPGASTPFDSAVVLEACKEALGDQDVQVVLTTGHQDLPRRFLPLPANFRYEPYVPGLAMAARSDLLIHHGGYGSCQTGLYTGTPALIIPTYSERESNARRVAAQGAGEFVLPSSDATGKNKRADAGEVREKALRILSDPSYRDNAVRLRERLRTYGGAAEAARLIEGVACPAARLGAAQS